MTPAALLALALLVALGVPAASLFWLLRRRAAASDDLRTVVLVVVGAVTVAPLLSTVLRPLVDASILGGALAPVVFAPVLEEIGKGSGIAFARRARASRRDGLFYGAVAGLSFAIVENALYVYAEFVVAGPTQGLVTAVYRAAGPVALHLSASALVGEALWMATTGQGVREGEGEGRRGIARGPGLAAIGLFLAAVGFHALANGVGRYGILWPLVIDAAAAGTVLWRVRRLR